MSLNGSPFGSNHSLIHRTSLNMRATDNIPLNYPCSFTDETHYDALWLCIVTNNKHCDPTYPNLETDPTFPNYTRLFGLFIHGIAIKVDNPSAMDDVAPFLLQAAWSPTQTLINADLKILFLLPVHAGYQLMLTLCYRNSEIHWTNFEYNGSCWERGSA